MSLHRIRLHATHNLTAYNTTQNPTVVENMRTATQIRSLFNRIDPRKSTPTAKALTRILEPYLQKLEAAHRAKEQGNASIQPIKPMNVVVLTGKRTDRD